LTVGEVKMISQLNFNKTKRLSSRELEVLQLLAEGLTNKELSDTLSISQNTTRNHVSNIYAKLKLDNRVQLALYALKSGISRGL
jgi:DNA-binding NarL/FixJ family response regulator